MITLPSSYNYVAAFLTLGCNFKCSYCINRPTGDLLPRDLISGTDWIDYLNQLELPDDLPITFQGGEPSLHPDFFEILKNIDPRLHIDVLTNLSFDVERLAREIPAERFLRKAPYAAIRVTYHPGQSRLEETLEKTKFLHERGYPIGLYCIRKPGFEKHIAHVDSEAKKMGLDHRTKEFLGVIQDEVQGTYHYQDGVFSQTTKSVQCRTTELLIAPDGNIHRCHRDLYLGEFSVGSVLDNYEPEYTFKTCSKFGECNPCDIKRKTNRFQVEGHASVEIQF